MERLKRIDIVIQQLEKEPNDVFLNYALGLEYVALQNLLNAEDQFKKVIELEPTNIAAYYQLGRLFESQSKNAEALIYFNKGLLEAKEQKNNKSVNEFEEAIFNLED